MSAVETQSSITLLRDEEPVLAAGFVPQSPPSAVAASSSSDPLSSESDSLYIDIEEPVEGSYQDFLAAGLSRLPSVLEPVMVEDSVQGPFTTSEDSMQGPFITTEDSVQGPFTTSEDSVQGPFTIAEDSVQGPFTTSEDSVQGPLGGNSGGAESSTDGIDSGEANLMVYDEQNGNNVNGGSVEREEVEIIDVVDSPIARRPQEEVL